MDISISGGDFDLDSRGMPYLLSGIAQLMQRVRFALKVQKGSFSLDEQLGSELALIDRKTNLLERRTEMLIREAVANVPQIQISNVNANFTDDDKLKIMLTIIYGDEKGSLEVII